MVKKILISGICGFLGAHVCEHIMKETDWDIIGIDRLSYASSGFDRIRDIEAYNHKKVKLLPVDLTKRISEGVLDEVGDVDYILHLAASTHVQNSIENPEPFVFDNVIGTFYILELAKQIKGLKKFIYFGTDEEMGDAPIGVEYKEDDPVNPRNPYAATKQGGASLCNAYHITYGLPIIRTRCMNIYGERQHPEKYVPLCIKKIINDDKISVHVNPKTQQPGSRFWIHARNVASALMFLLDNGKNGEIYHIAPPDELDNLEIAQKIADIIGKPLNYELVDWHSKRPGHDSRYALNGDKLKKLGWKMPVSFEESFKKTVKWSIREENKKWLGL